MQTENDYPISSSWVDINELSGIAIGQQMALHNAGRAGDIIEVAVSELEPISTFRGIAIKALTPMFLVSPQDLPLWVRYIRYDLTGTITPLPVRTCLLNVQSIADIQEIGGIPSALLTSNDKDMLLKVSIGNLSDVAYVLASQLSSLVESQENTVLQLRLLNAKTEEAFETQITQDDV